MKRSPMPPRKTPMRNKSKKVRDESTAGSIEQSTGKRAEGIQPARTPIKARSKKRVEQQKRRLETWEPGLTPCMVRLPGTCTGLAEGLHERRKSSAGGDREPGRNTIPACNRCNGAIEDDVLMARQAVAVDSRSLVVREGDAEWEQLGARARREADTAERPE